MPGFPRFLYSQLFVTPPLPTASQAGKTIIVTGANTGLGKEAVRHFTRLGASTVILAVRSLEKGEEAKKDIEASTGRSDVLQVWHLDMSSYQSVLAFANRVAKELPRLDTAVLNAGVNRGKWEIFEQDESTLTVNVISTFLLAFALMPKLVETSEKFHIRPNLTVVTSETHEFSLPYYGLNAPEGEILERLNERVVDGKEIEMLKRYEVSKLLQILFVRAWCERKAVADCPVTINLVNPGLCPSEVNREIPSLALTIFMFLLARRIEICSRSLVVAASLGPESHGRYVTNCRIEDPGAWLLTEEAHGVASNVYGEVLWRLEGIKGGITNGF